MIETIRSAVVFTYGPDSKRTMLAIKIPRFSMSKAPISRMIKPVVMRRAPHGMRSVILHDLYLLQVKLVAVCQDRSSCRLTMSAMHELRQRRSKLPQSSAARSCLVDRTKHCQVLYQRIQSQYVALSVATYAVLTVVLSHVRDGLVYELRRSFTTHVGDLGDQEGVDDLAPETGDRLRNGKEHSSTL